MKAKPVARPLAREVRTRSVQILKRLYVYLWQLLCEHGLLKNNLLVSACGEKEIASSPTPRLPLDHVGVFSQLAWLLSRVNGPWCAGCEMCQAQGRPVTGHPRCTHHPEYGELNNGECVYSHERETRRVHTAPGGRALPLGRCALT